MCYRKKELKNRILESHRSGFDKEKIKAPCGVCPSCRRVRTNEWLVRSYYEFLGNNSQAFFLSLDYDPRHLPTYNGVPCFDSEIIKHFLYRLRQRIGRFRYFYVSEYGGFLKRPHNHMLVLPHNYISELDFDIAVSLTWQQGRHTKIDVLESVDGDKIKAINYIVGYCTKDITWRPEDDEKLKDIPMRFRPRTQASKGFGLRALEEGIISPQDLLDGKTVDLPIGSNGKIVSYPIPRYYEMKLCYDYKWDKVAHKAELIKNDFGVQVCKKRHNRCYVFQLRKFFSSRLLDIHNLDFYKDTIFYGRSWREVVYDCCTDLHDFAEFFYYRPFISFLGKDYVRDNIRNESLYRPNWYYFDAAYQTYEVFWNQIYETQCRIETEKLVHAAKERAKWKLIHNHQLASYLRKKNYDFGLLYN